MITLITKEYKEVPLFICTSVAPPYVWLTYGYTPVLEYNKWHSHDGTLMIFGIGQCLIFSLIYKNIIKNNNVLSLEIQNQKIKTNISHPTQRKKNVTLFLLSYRKKTYIIKYGLVVIVWKLDV